MSRDRRSNSYKKLPNLKIALTLHLLKNCSLKAHFAEFPPRFTHREHFKFYLKMSFPTFIQGILYASLKDFTRVLLRDKFCKEESHVRYQHAIQGYVRHVFMKSCLWAMSFWEFVARISIAIILADQLKCIYLLLFFTSIVTHSHILNLSSCVKATRNIPRHSFISTLLLCLL